VASSALLSLIAGGVFGEQPRARADAAASKPNILHILTDDQTVESVRYMQRTKALIGDQGTTFRNYNDVQPLCCPSRATFLSGQYPHNHGVLRNLPPYGYGALDWDHTLYTALDDAGYRTGWIGKVLNPSRRTQAIEPEPGFDYWLVSINDAETDGVDMFEYQLSEDGDVIKRDGVFQTNLFEDRALRFIRTSAGQPFLLTVSVHSPHWAPCGPNHEVRECPPQPAPRDRNLFKGIRYPFGPNFKGTPADRKAASHYWRREAQSLQSVDRMVASLVEELHSEGVLDDTYLIFQSDNGYMHGEHGESDLKNVPWEETTVVPLMIRGPGFAAGAVRDDLTANVDVPATILDVADATPPVPGDGYSLLSGHRRSELLLERLVGSRNSTIAAKRPWRQIKTSDGWTYWSDLDGGHKHLYDLDDDPYELKNLVGKTGSSSIGSSLAARLNSIKDCAAPCP